MTMATKKSQSMAAWAIVPRTSSTAISDVFFSRAKARFALSNYANRTHYQIVKANAIRL